MLFQVQIQPKSIKSVSVYGNCGETTQAHYMTMLYNWLMHDIIIIILISLIMIIIIIIMIIIIIIIIIIFFTGNKPLAIWEDHIWEKRTLIASSILTKNDQVAFNICAFIISNLFEMFSRFRNIFSYKICQFYVVIFVFSWTSNLGMIVLLIVHQ